MLDGTVEYGSAIEGWLESGNASEREGRGSAGERAVRTTTARQGNERGALDERQAADATDTVGERWHVVMRS